MFNLLIVDDDDHVLKSLARLLRSKDYSISCFSDPEEALRQCSLQEFDLILSDQRMPGLEGTALFSHISRSFPSIRRILISGYSDFSSVTEAFNDGVIHKFVLKPWNTELLKKLVAAQLKIKQQDVDEELLQVEEIDKNNSPHSILGHGPAQNFHGIVTSDAAMLQQIAIIQKAANSEAPFFIHGETGTGKELVARAIHLESNRAEQNFVALNCANLTENLLESQLFGHVKGAFTGADRDKKGLLAEAEKGTLFMDEVTAIPFMLQSKLLRVLQEREYTPVGETKCIAFDVQLISASSLNLEEAVAKGQFREDLRYRLEVMPIELPPLRARKADIRALFDYFLAIQFKRYKRTGIKVDDSVYRCIENYRWPGNVRELLNVCVYITALADEEIQIITTDHLPSVITSSTNMSADTSNHVPASVSTATWQRQSGARVITRESLAKAMEEFSSNRESIANHFGVSRMTLWRKMKQLDRSD